MLFLTLVRVFELANSRIALRSNCVAFRFGLNSSGLSGSAGGTKAGSSTFFWTLVCFFVDLVSFFIFFSALAATAGSSPRMRDRSCDM